LLFQALDNKIECYKIFCNGALHDDYDISSLTHTWYISKNITDLNVEYAKIWAHGQDLQGVCPEDLLPRWKSVSSQAKVFLKTFREAKINLEDVCFYDLVPESFLLDYYDVKNSITRHVFNSYDKPKNYDFMKNLVYFLQDIEQNELNISFENLSLENEKVRNCLGKLKAAGKTISYNPWGTVTGRLTTNKNSFPILTLNKELRPALVPKNDLFLELDYNAAEIRTLLGLLGEEQPAMDVHEWISKEIFDSKFNREETKLKVFGWLYNPKAKNKRLNNFLDRDKILEKYYVNDRVCTPFNRCIEVDNDKAVNYLVQSTSSDMFLSSAMSAASLLKNKKSFVSFCIHDSLVIDISAEDKPLIEQIIDTFSKTRFGDLKTNVSLGKNFGAMRKIR
tara:strand:+ start:729 stop:1907 length:1179 start_codon:yes stop_codon:yes gene_type:complete